MPVTVRPPILNPTLTQALSDWSTPFGVFSAPVRPRVGPPHFIYRGSADEHLVGQPCYPDPDNLATGDTRGVIMACGCRLIVPWWTLEPFRP